MGLVRQLIVSAIDAAQRPAADAPPAPADGHAKEAAVGTKDVAHGSEDSGYKHEAPSPYAAPAPAADMGRHGRKRGGLKDPIKAALRPLKGYESEGSCRTFLRYFNACGMAKSAEQRRTQALDVAQGLAFSLIIVGAIFLGLSASGNFMGSVEEMKYVGTYAPAVAKYSVYIFAGISGVVGALLTRRACTRRTSFRLPACVLAVAAAAVLASLGLGFYQLDKSVELHSPWWSYLLSALMIVQRCLYLVMLGYLLYTMKEGSKDEAIKEQMITNQRAHEAARNGGAPPPPHKGEVLV
ncbi:hypothetical protein COHA_010564 [Chlorella ohadii]|uniref:Uncharacterized protein n=1 Tax=Chlorella ohadii TaxID=2649997 RepID=A0AAD5GWV4_9CHLO|nr:hypothetical protein COHA_010564 [Chlorella ohadii]